MLHVRLAVPLALAGMVLSACALESAVRKGSAESGVSAVTSTNPMIGKAAEALVERYGEPEALFDIGGSRTAYVYDDDHQANDTDEDCNDAYVVNQAGLIINYYCR